MADKQYTIHARDLTITGTFEALEWIVCELPPSDGCTMDLMKDLQRVEDEMELDQALDL